GRHLGLKGEFSEQFSNLEGQGVVQVPCGTTTCPAQLQVKFDRKLFNFLAGPEYKLRNHTRYTPFGYALVGVVHTTAGFSTHGSTVSLDLSTSETGFSTAFGLGLDVRMSRHFSLRNQVDINPKYVGRDDNGARIWLHDLRFSVGVLVH